jgi:hypothetical protein
LVGLFKPTLFLASVLLAGHSRVAKAEDAKPFTIKKLGTLDLLMVETTPVVFKDSRIMRR